MKTWTKGGIIGLIISFILMVLSLADSISELIWYIIVFLAPPIIILNNYIESITILYVALIIYGILTGGIIGLIIEKVKNKKLLILIGMILVGIYLYFSFLKSYGILLIIISTISWIIGKIKTRNITKKRC